MDWLFECSHITLNGQGSGARNPPMSSINTNVSSLIAGRVHAQNKLSLTHSLINLATGSRISRAAFDPAGLISSERLRSALSTLEAESRSFQRAGSVATVAEGALAEASGLLIEAKGLALTNANSFGISDAERQANQMQIDSILSSVDRISSTTSFNGDPLLDGSASFSVGGQTLDITSVATSQIGDVTIDGDDFILSDVASEGVLNTVDGNVEGAVAAIDAAIDQVSTLRGQIGAFQRHTVASGLASIDVAIENVSAANSLIRDTDFAAETSRLSSTLLLDLSSLKAISLTNSFGAGVLKLLD